MVMNFGPKLKGTAKCEILVLHLQMKQTSITQRKVKQQEHMWTRISFRHIAQYPAGIFNYHEAEFVYQLKILDQNFSHLKAFC